jgi:hypothetical protein
MIPTFHLDQTVGLPKHHCWANRSTSAARDIFDLETVKFPLGAWLVREFAILGRRLPRSLHRRRLFEDEDGGRRGIQDTSGCSCGPPEAMLVGQTGGRPVSFVPSAVLVYARAAQSSASIRNGHWRPCPSTRSPRLDDFLDDVHAVHCTASPFIDLGSPMGAARPWSTRSGYPGSSCRRQGPPQAAGGG